MRNEDRAGMKTWDESRVYGRGMRAGFMAGERKLGMLAEGKATDKGREFGQGMSWGRGR